MQGNIRRKENLPIEITEPNLLQHKNGNISELQVF